MTGSTYRVEEFLGFERINGKKTPKWGLRARSLPWNEAKSKHQELANELSQEGFLEKSAEHGEAYRGHRGSQNFHNNESEKALKREPKK